MGRAILAISGSAAAHLPRPVVRFAAAVRAPFGVLSRRMRSGYHPERHYMRGPGPACQARDGRRA